MAFKRDSWLVRGILVLAIAALAAGSVAFAFGGRAGNRTGSAVSDLPAEDQTDILQGRVEAYNIVLAREPDNESVLLNLVEAKAALGDIEGTLEPLERLAELKADVPDYTIVLAQTKQQLGDLDGAAQAYRRVLTQNPGEIRALSGLVALLLSQERSEAAVGLLRDTLATADQTNEIAPGSVNKLSVKLLLGEVFAEQEKLDEALAIYDEAIADTNAASPTPPDFRPFLSKGLILQEKGETAEAKILFDQALALAPANYKDDVQQLITEKSTPIEPEAAASDDTSAVETPPAVEPPVAPPAPEPSAP